MGSIFEQMGLAWSAAPAEVPAPAQSLRASAGGMGGWPGQSGAPGFLGPLSGPGPAGLWRSEASLWRVRLLAYFCWS